MRLLSLALLASPSLGQFVAHGADYLNLTVVKSPGDSNVTVSYKQPDGVCNTAFDTQAQYTGFVNVPGDYPTNLFFWFVEAREKTDALTIWLNGGPGSSSLYGFFTGNGPCEVVQRGLNEYETVARDWGWDRASNMLFVDQPNQVGFSYDTPTDATLLLLKGGYQHFQTESKPAWSAANGTFSSQLLNNTANTTETAAIAVWHMLQGFLAAFPQYQAHNRSSVDVNLFAESYGGRYGPIFADTFEAQNEKRLTGELNQSSTLDVNLVSLGIVNGCADWLTQAPFYMKFATENTYGYKALSKSEAEYYSDKLSASGGCEDLLTQCATEAESDDPDGEGDEAAVNSICAQAYESCNGIQDAYASADRSFYDLAHPLADPFPALDYLEYLNQGTIQRAVGSPVNFTMSSDAVAYAFAQTGDLARGGTIPKLADLVSRGIRVGLIYGDRDYICNWMGGEALSLMVAQQAGAPYSDGFPAAGYAPIVVNDSYVGGAVRQYGNLSFSRVYQSGHSVAAYQPETAFQIFARIVAEGGSSVSTGEPADLGLYNTTGPANATEKGALPDAPTPTCYIRAFASTCNDAAFALAQKDEGVVINGVLYASSADWPLAAAETSSAATGTKTESETSKSTGTETLTGAFTATGTPDSAAGGLAPHLLVLCGALLAAFCAQVA